ncbi:MAG: hypothetical protein V1750_10520, partial [Acidobacteriota bacterium]
MKTLTSVVVILSALAVPASVWARAPQPQPEIAIQASPTAPPVEDLVAAALERSPSVAALRERLAAAREMVAPAGALPDPMVEMMLTDVGFPRWTVGKEEMSMVGTEVRQ